MTQAKPQSRVTKPKQPDAITLDKNHPFECVVHDMVEMNRAKAKKYANDQNLFANFDRNASMQFLKDYDAFADCFSMVTRKIARIQNLKQGGSEPSDDTLADSLIDLAVYAVLLIGIHRRDGSIK